LFLKEVGLFRSGDLRRIGVNFALFTANATSVDLCLFDGREPRSGDG